VRKSINRWRTCAHATPLGTVAQDRSMPRGVAVRGRVDCTISAIRSHRNAKGRRERESRGRESLRLVGGAQSARTRRSVFPPKTDVLQLPGSSERELPKLPAEKNGLLGTTSRGPERLQVPVFHFSARKQVRGTIPKNDLNLALMPHNPRGHSGPGGSIPGLKKVGRSGERYVAVSSIDKIFPAGSLNHAIVGPFPREIPRSSVCKLGSL
jgi:hypothetical protein